MAKHKKKETEVPAEPKSKVELGLERRVRIWITDLDWYETICIHAEEGLRQYIETRIREERGGEFTSCLQWKVIESPKDLISLRGLKFSLTAWPESLNQFPPFVIAEFCALKEKSDARKARK